MRKHADALLKRGASGNTVWLFGKRHGVAGTLRKLHAPRIGKSEDLATGAGRGG